MNTSISPKDKESTKMTADYSEELNHRWLMNHRWLYIKEADFLLEVVGQ